MSHTCYFAPRHAKPHAIEDDLKIIHGWEAFESLYLEKGSDAFSGVIIPAEILWENENYQDFYGFDLLQALRLKYRLRCPVIITSVLDAKQIGFQDHKGKFRFWKDPSLSYVPFRQLSQMTLTEISAKFEAPLEERLHQDLCDTLYDQQGYLLQLILHDLTNILRNENIQDRQQAIKALFGHFYKMGSHNIVAACYKKLSKEIEEGNLPDQPRLMTIFAPLLKKATKIEMAPLVYTDTWEVLFIDDDGLQPLTNQLQALGITCKYTSSKDEAIEILKADTYNRITVVVCDFRFYDGSGRYARWQGYHIIEALGKLPRYVSFITLTEFHQTQVVPLTQKIRFKVTTFCKDDIFNRNYQGIQLFTKLLIDENLRVQKLILTSPNLKENTRLYQLHLESEDYHSIEENINQMVLDALRCVEQAKWGNRVERFPDENYQGRTNLNEEAENLENFRIKLLGRRIAIGLCQFRETIFFRCSNTRNFWLAVGSLLRTGVLEIGREEGLSDLLNTHLRLSVKKLYLRERIDTLKLTMEERRWLEAFSPDHLNDGYDEVSVDK